MQPDRIEKLLFALIILGYGIVGILFATQTPAWQAPDEPAHFNYVAQVTDSCCPLVEEGDWQSEYQQQLTSVKFHPEYLDRLDTIQYEDHQPPLYYLLATLPYVLTDGSLIAVRLFSTLLGGIVVVLTYMIGKRVLPNKPQVALGAMALVAFQPQHLSIITSVNNDALAEVVIAVALLWIVRYLQTDKVPVWQLGLIMAMGLMTKTTTYFLAGVIPLAILLKWHAQQQSPRLLIRAWTVFLVIALGIGGLWWVRNISVYGFPDFLALGAHDEIVADQKRTADYIAENGIDTYTREMIRVTFNSFWGQFGWMAVPLDNVLGGWIYRGFAILMLVGASGLVIARLPRKSEATANPEARRTQLNMWVVLTVMIILAVLAYLYYNSEFLQFQGRYMFAGLIPFALVIMYGVDAWRDRLLSRWEMTQWLTPLAMMGLAVVDVYLLFVVIVPNLSP